ncbi:hypothetical protein D1872_287570 [compost metagenome]
MNPTDIGFVGRACVGIVRLFLQQRELPEEVAREEQAQNMLLAVVRQLGQLDDSPAQDV